MFTLEQIALEVEGVIVGDNSISITEVDDIEHASSGSIAFAFLPKYKKSIPSSNASAFVVTNEEDLQNLPGIIVQNPYLAMIKILDLFSNTISPDYTINQNAEISNSASLGKNVGIGPFTVIGDDVKIGDNVMIGSGVKIGSSTTIRSNSVIKDNVVIYDNISIGENTIINSGSIVGSDGFGFTTIEKVHHKIPHIKTVIIGNFVEIGASCNIDRGSVKNTVIEDHCKFDNQIHIAHNVTVQEGCLLAAGVTVGGSTTIGAYSQIGGETAIGPHLVLGEECMFAARSCVLKSLDGGQLYAGNPARPLKEKQKRDAVFTRLELLEKRLKK